MHTPSRPPVDLSYEARYRRTTVYYRRSSSHWCVQVWNWETLLPDCHKPTLLIHLPSPRLRIHPYQGFRLTHPTTYHPLSELQCVPPPTLRSEPLCMHAYNSAFLKIYLCSLSQALPGRPIRICLSVQSRLDPCYLVLSVEDCCMHDVSGCTACLHWGDPSLGEKQDSFFLYCTVMSYLRATKFLSEQELA